MSLVQSRIGKKIFYRPFKVTLPSKWDKVFKNRPSKICGRQPFKNLK